MCSNLPWKTAGVIMSESTYRLASSMSASDAWWCATSNAPVAPSTNTAVDESAPPGPKSRGADSDPTARPSESSTCSSSARKPSRAVRDALMGARRRIAPPNRSSQLRSAASPPMTGRPPGCTHARNEFREDASSRPDLCAQGHSSPSCSLNHTTYRGGVHTTLAWPSGPLNPHLSS